jgi:hypothetical protein
MRIGALKTLASRPRAPRDVRLALLHCHQQMHMDTGFRRLLKIVW